MHICVSLHASVLMHRLPTRVRSHLTVISYSPETSGSRSCDGDSNGLSQIWLAFLSYSPVRSFITIGYWIRAHTVRTCRHLSTVRSSQHAPWPWWELSSCDAWSRSIDPLCRQRAVLDPTSVAVWAKWNVYFVISPVGFKVMPQNFPAAPVTPVSGDQSEVSRYRWP